MTKTDSVLIVDDEVALTRLYETILKGEGYPVAVAHSGEAALSYLSSVPAPALILLDCSMPKMSGEEFLKELRAKAPQVVEQSRIIGFSSFNARIELIREFASAVAEFVPKPLDLDEFLRMIEEQLEMARETRGKP